MGGRGPAPRPRGPARPWRRRPLREKKQQGQGLGHGALGFVPYKRKRHDFSPCFHSEEGGRRGKGLTVGEISAAGDLAGGGGGWLEWNGESGENGWEQRAYRGEEEEWLEDLGNSG